MQLKSPTEINVGYIAPISHYVAVRKSRPDIKTEDYYAIDLLY